MSQLDVRLSQLSSHERALAEAQMARAEAIADAVSALVAGCRKLGNAIAARAAAYTDRRTRRWPHAKNGRDVAEFPSIGLQH